MQSSSVHVLDRGSYVQTSLNHVTPSVPPKLRWELVTSVVNTLGRIHTGKVYRSKSLRSGLCELVETRPVAKPDLSCSVAAPPSGLQKIVENSGQKLLGR